jgi:hypothetical protein
VKPRRPVLVACMGLMLIVFAACSGDDPVRVVLPEITTTVAVCPAVALQGTRVLVTIGLTNEGDRMAELSLQKGCLTGFELTTPTGQVISCPRECPSKERMRFTMPVGVKVVLWEEVPTLRDDMDNVVWPLSQDRLQPGVYTVRAGLLGYEHRIEWGEATFTVR